MHNHFVCSMSWSLYIYIHDIDRSQTWYIRKSWHDKILLGLVYVENGSNIKAQPR